MEENLQEVRREIELTRRALGEKVSRLEQKIETTKNTTLNPAYHVRTRPWPTLGSTVVAGFLLGRMFRSRSSARRNGVYTPSLTKTAIAPAAANIVSLLAANFLRDYFAKRHENRFEE